MKDLSRIKEILHRNDYEVIAVPSNDGCIVTYPMRLEQPLPIPNIYTEYVFEKTGLRYTCKIDNQPEITEHLKVPKYARRHAIYGSIIKNCRYVRYNPLLVTYQLEDKQVNVLEFLKVLPIQMSKKDLEKEDSLIQAFSLLAQIGLNEEVQEFVKDKEIEEGFNIVAKFLLEDAS